MVQLGATAGHLVLGTTVGDDGVLGAQALGGTDGVHGHVAAAKDNDVLAVLGGGVVLGELVGLHQVHAGEVLVREEDVGQVLAGDVEELGQAVAILPTTELYSNLTPMSSKPSISRLTTALGRRNSGMP